MIYINHMNKLFSTFYMIQKLTKVIEISKGSSYPQPDQTHHKNDNEHTVPTTLSIYLSCERTTLKMLELSIVHDSWKKILHDTCMQISLAGK